MIKLINILYEITIKQPVVLHVGKKYDILFDAEEEGEREWIGPYFYTGNEYFEGKKFDGFEVRDDLGRFDHGVTIPEEFTKQFLQNEWIRYSKLDQIKR